MKKLNKKVLISLDNAPSHLKVSLENVELVFLPPNATSHFQPLDQRIIQNFKLAYQHFLLKNLDYNGKK